MTAKLFTGFILEPEDLLEEEEEVRRIDCRHDPPSDKNFCGECGIRLNRYDYKVKLRDRFRELLDPPDEQYVPIDSDDVFDWLIGVVETEFGLDVGCTDRSIVAGRRLAETSGSGVASPECDVDTATGEVHDAIEEFGLDVEPGPVLLEEEN